MICPFGQLRKFLPWFSAVQPKKEEFKCDKYVIFWKCLVIRGFSESCFWLNVAGLVSLTFSLLLLAWVHVFERLAELMGT